MARPKNLTDAFVETQLVAVSQTAYVDPWSEQRLCDTGRPPPPPVDWGRSVALRG